MKTKLFFIITFLSFTLVGAQAVDDVYTIGDLKYKITATGGPYTVKVSNDLGVTGNVTIPSSVDIEGVPYDVTAIGLKAFFQNALLTGLVLPSSVTLIEESAFQECTGLLSANLENLVQIDKRGFRQCESLVPTDTNFANLTTTGPSAFDRCNGFTTISLPVLTNQSSYTFVTCSNISSVTLSSSLTEIPLGMFDQNTSLSSITIPSGVTTIGKWAFRNTGLTSVTSLNLTPPTANAEAFISSNYTTIPLSVPSGAEAAYSAAAVWEDFASVAVLNVGNVEKDLDFSVYPNPVNDVVFVKGEALSDAVVSVYDFSGKVLLSANTTGIVSEINVSSLATGVYLLKIKTQTAEFTKKIVKQ